MCWSEYSTITKVDLLVRKRVNRLVQSVRWTVTYHVSAVHNHMTVLFHPFADNTTNAVPGVATHLNNGQIHSSLKNVIRKALQLIVINKQLHQFAESGEQLRM